MKLKIGEKPRVFVLDVDGVGPKIIVNYKHAEVRLIENYVGVQTELA